MYQVSIGTHIVGYHAPKSYYSSVRATPFAFRATQKTEREKHCFFSFSQNDNTGVLCVGAAVLFFTEILFAPHTKPRCCHFVRKKKNSDTASETDPQTGKVWRCSIVSIRGRFPCHCDCHCHFWQCMKSSIEKKSLVRCVLCTV